MSNIAYAMSQPAQNVPGQPAANPIGGFIPIILIFAIFYFLMIRPQQKQQKKQQEMISKLSKNDEVVTSGGLHGTIVNVEEKTVTLRVDDNTRIKFQRSAISYVKQKPSQGEKKA